MERPERFIPTSITDYALNNVKVARQLGKEKIETQIKYYNDKEDNEGLYNIEEEFREYYEELLFYFNEYDGIDVDKLKVIETKGVRWNVNGADICL